MTDKVEEILAGLPGFDCARCGAGSCRELAERIAAGDAAAEDCDAAWDDSVELVINGEVIPLTEFPRAFLRGTVIGAVSALKGVGAVETLQLRLVERGDD